MEVIGVIFLQALWLTPTLLQEIKSIWELFVPEQSGTREAQRCPSYFFNSPPVIFLIPLLIPVCRINLWQVSTGSQCSYPTFLMYASSSAVPQGTPPSVPDVRQHHSHLQGHACDVKITDLRGCFHPDSATRPIPAAEISTLFPGGCWPPQVTFFSYLLVSLAQNKAHFRWKVLQMFYSLPMEMQWCILSKAVNLLICSCLRTQYCCNRAIPPLGSSCSEQCSLIKCRL